MIGGRTVPDQDGNQIPAGLSDNREPLSSDLMTFFRRLLRWTLWTLAALIAITAATVVYVSVVGIPVDASALRAPIARAFSESIGRQVRFVGPMELEISGRPKLRVGGLHIAGPDGAASPDLASLGEARLALDLWQLFRRRLHVDELSGTDVKIRLERRGDGSNNWTFDLSGTASVEPRAPVSSTPGPELPTVHIQRVSLERVAVEYVTPYGRSHFFDLHSMSAQAQAGKPFSLTLAGAVEKSFPYRLDFAGGPLQDLLRADRPWPIELTLTFLSSTLTLNGTVSGAGGDLRFGLGTESLSEFERLFQTQLPPVGATAVAGRVEFTARKVRLSELAGVMGSTTMVGDLDFDSTGARPKISGSLAIPWLDLRPFLISRSQDSSEAIAQMAVPPRSLADSYRELSRISFSLSQLAGIDADLSLQVGNWLSLPGDVREASLQVKLESGKLEVPIRATVSGVTLRGAAQADASASPPRFRMSLATRDSDLGGLAELLAGLRGVQGHLGRFELQIAARGDQVSELVRSLDVRMEIDRARLSYGNIEGGRPVDFELGRLSVVLPPGQPLAGDLSGSLLGRALTASLRGGALEPMMIEGRSRLDFDVQSGQLKARVRGTVAQPGAREGPDLAFELSAPRANAVASWLGFVPGSEASVNLGGKVSVRHDSWKVEGLRFQVGRTSLAADLEQTRANGTPLLKARLDADSIDVKEIESMIPRTQKSSASGPVLDIPILPKGIDLTDADIAVRVKRFDGSPLEIRDVSFDGRVREGYMHPSQFSVDVGEAKFGGAILLDLRGEQPEARLWLSADDVNIGNLLRRLNVAQGVDARLDLMRLYLATRSSRLGDMLSQADLTATFAGGRLTLRDPNTRAEARIALQTGLLRALPGLPLSLDLSGALDDIPVTIAVETAPARELADPLLRLPFKLTAEAASTRLVLSGGISRPLDNKDVELALQAGGERLNHLDRLVRASLPPWGPWSAAGKFRMSARGYEVTDLLLQVGESALAGAGGLRTDTPRPRLDISLTAPNIQLDDFKLGDWSAFERRPVEDKAPTAEEIKDKAAKASDEAQRLLSPAVLNRQDAYLDVRVDQVRSGRDELGGGKLNARLENGRADIGPVEVDTPGGSVKLWLGYEPSERDVQVDMRIDVEKFDYGILARRVKPDTDLQGVFSAHVKVNSRARYLSDALRHGNGRIEFAIWPENMKAGVFDLWAVNVLVALVPAVDPSRESRVNCAVGRFELVDGRLEDRGIILDTTRMRVVGTGHADFDQQEVTLRMRPQAKTAQFLSLATPVELSGSFTDFKVGVSPGDVVETVGRVATSVVWVPLKKLFGRRIPQDGSDVCANPLSFLAQP
jgi:uncharacterized protein involved in outer membrane biogenesis